MTTTINQSTYLDLLCETVPMVIEDEQAYHHFLSIAEQLVANKSLSLEEQELLKLLTTLIETYEAEHFSMGESSPQAMLACLMESNALEPTDLAKLLGSSEAAIAIAQGNRAIDASQATTLGAYFGLPPTVFL